ncbi:hypothetical protein G7054_g4166 [Neopestalotiopsis clavispora]|nr:hypothetical protein G7054_g4166 [Neopestalotiopsis clavispora]
MESDKQIVFYDIVSGPPRRTYAPNPWKTRYAMNFKGVDYRTAWVELPEVTRTRKELGVPPSRYHADGSPFYTLPMIQDLSTGKFVGDTFDIAVYLDQQYPDKPTLIPSRSTAVFKAFNKQMDALFTATVALWGQGLPFNPENAEEAKAEFSRRANGLPFEEMTVKGEARRQLLDQCKEKLGELAELFREPEESFLEGAEATYADFIIGGWVTTMSICLPDDDWTEMRSWHSGRWAKLHAGLQKYANVK